MEEQKKQVNDYHYEGIVIFSPVSVCFQKSTTWSRPLSMFSCSMLNYTGGGQNKSVSVGLIISPAGAPKIHPLQCTSLCLAYSGDC